MARQKPAYSSLSNPMVRSAQILLACPRLGLKSKFQIVEKYSTGHLEHLLNIIRTPKAQKKQKTSRDGSQQAMQALWKKILGICGLLTGLKMLAK